MRNSASLLQVFKILNEIDRTVGGINEEEVLSMLPKYKVKPKPSFKVQDVIFESATLALSKD